jgi:proline racemase
MGFSTVLHTTEIEALMPIELPNVAVTDYHTAGEPFRIVTDGVPEIVGATVLQRREYAQRSTDVDAIRLLLVNEPRGHADMYGGFIVPPNDEGAVFGVLFWHRDGYSTACGHGTIALGTWAVHTGLVPAAADGDTDVVIDVPSGRVTARVRCEAGRVRHVAFCNVASYVVARDVQVHTTRGAVRVDISYGGALYASVSAASAGLAVDAIHYAELITIGREIKCALNETLWAQHPSDPRLNGIYGTILFDDLGDSADGPHQRNVTVFADGEVDRSPCGSGTSARLALLTEDGRMTAGRALRHESIVNTTFLGRVIGDVHAEGRCAVLTEVQGAAYRTGSARFSLDPDDGLGTGFVLR